MKNNDSKSNLFDASLARLRCLFKKHSRLGYGLYIASFALLMLVVGFSYGSADAAVTNLPATTATVGVNGMQGKNSDSSNDMPSSITNAKKPPRKGTNTVADIKAVNIASDVANLAGLSSTNSILSNAESANVSATLAQANASTASKRSTASSTRVDKAVDTYDVVQGDNVPLVAEKFGISPETLKLANNLNSDILNPGMKLTIPATDGIVYTFHNGDTIEDISNRYHISVDDILTFNNLDRNNIKDGTRILLPNAAIPEVVAPVAPGRPLAPAPGRPLAPAPGRPLAPAPVVVMPRPRIPVMSGNNYAYGYCTWYAYNRRRQLGLPVAGGWGNANTWDTRAAMSGYIVDRTPSVGAIFQTDNGPFGHVGVVERVNSDGTITVSEMNYTRWNVKSTRTISPAPFKFIH